MSKRTFTIYAQRRTDELISSLIPVSEGDEEIAQLYENMPEPDKTGEITKEIIKFLKDELGRMTFSKGLERLVREKFNLGKNAKKSLLAEKLHEAFTGRGIPVTDRTDGDKRDLRKKERERIEDWFTKGAKEERWEFLSKISFALELDEVETARFIIKELGEQSYNIRDIKELIILFCHHKKAGYDKCRELFDEYAAQFPEEKKKGSKEKKKIVDDGYTRLFKDNREDIFESEETFTNFLKENKKYFTAIRRGTGIFFCDEYDRLLKETEYAGLPVKGYKDKEIGFEAEKWKIKFDGKTKASLLPKWFMEKPLTSARISNIKSGKINVSKKDLVTLRFYRFCVNRHKIIRDKGENEKINLEKDAAAFIFDLNATLDEYEFFQLYDGYKFDCLVKIAIHLLHPEEIFNMVLWSGQKDDFWSFSWEDEAAAADEGM